MEDEAPARLATACAGCTGVARWSARATQWDWAVVAQATTAQAHASERLQDYARAHGHAQHAAPMVVNLQVRL